MIREFKEFITRGNLVELAVAFIMGVAFTGVVTAFSNTILDAVSFVFGGEVSFDEFAVHRGETPVIRYGPLLTAVLNLVLVAIVLFLLVKAYNRFLRRREETPSTRPCPFCATSIAKSATRCPACTSTVEAVGP